MNSHPSEILVIEITHLFATITDAKRFRFQQKLLDIFDGLLYPKTLSGGISATIGEMRRKNQRVVLAIEDATLQDHPLLWPNSLIHNTFADTIDLPSMISFNENRMKDFEALSSTSEMYKISWTLTPNTGWVIQHLPRQMGLYQPVVQANNAMSDFLTRQRENGAKQFGQIFIVDFFETTDIVTELNPQCFTEFN